MADASIRPETLLRHLLETVTVFDAEGRVLYSTGDEGGALGYDPGSLAGRSAWDHVHPADLGRAAEQFARCVAGPGSSSFGEIRVRHADGSWEHVEATLTNLLDDPTVGGILLTSRNVTDRVEAQEALRRSEQRFRALVRHAADLVTVVDADGRISYVSPAATVMLGVEPDRVIALGSYEALVHPDDHERATQAFAQALSATVAVEVGLRILRPDGGIRHVEVTITDLRDEPAVGGVVVNAHDVTGRARAEAALAHQALHDPLTGLPNRVLLSDRVAQALARQQRHHTGVAVMFCDLDRFKVVNDSLGHDVGDQLLVEMGERLARSVRASDTVGRIGATVGRLGGDEFIVVCEGFSDHGDLERLARRLLDAIERPADLPGGPVVVSASIGIAVADEHTHPEELLRDADAAMYLAKERGKARFELFDQELRARTVGRLATERALREALGRDQLRLAYQPVVDLTTGEVVAAEALLRWEHPALGLVGPAAFLEVAEETGLIVPLGGWVASTAAASTAGWRVGGGWRTWVNLSARELADGGLVDRLLRSADEAGVPPSSLGIEITESTLLVDAALAADALRRLHDAGVGLALDDFGTGYSSLAHLQRFPVDTVKIDRTFVQGVATGDAPIVAAIVAMAGALGLQVVAEGVETEAQAGALVELGCTTAQGFLLGRPMSAEQLARRLGPTRP